MSASRFNKKTVIFSLIIATLAGGYCLLRPSQTVPKNEKMEAEVAEAATPAKPTVAVTNERQEASVAGASAVVAKVDTHGNDCAHCQPQKPVNAEPHLLTNPKVDHIFKDLASMKVRGIPVDTFDFLRGSQIGNTASFQIGEQQYSGTIRLVRENHELARSYAMDLDDNFGKVLVTTDAGGYLMARIFFMGDSRVILAGSKRDQGMDGMGVPELQVGATTVSDLLCAKSDTILTETGFKSLSELAALEVAEKALPAPSAPVIAPAFESSPDSSYVLYCDFDGETVTDTTWNIFYGEEIVALPLARATDQEWINLVWRRVVEDFAPFNINVTTDRAVYDATDVDKRLHVVITSSTTVTTSGVAFLYSFREDSPVVWVGHSEESLCASTISHEAGHAFGLTHDYLIGTERPNDYYFGHNTLYRPGWAPIMGAFFGDGFYDEVDQWSIGEFTNSANSEDDIAILGDTVDPQDNVDVNVFLDGTAVYPDPYAAYQLALVSNGFGYKADDYSDTSLGNTGTFEIIGENLITASGLITSRTDVDYFKLEVSDGDFRLRVLPLDVDSLYPEAGSETSGANLAVTATLWDDLGNLLTVGVEDGSNQLGALIDATYLTAGTYYLAVEGAARGNGTGGFTDYASMGEYTIIGELDLPPLKVDGGPKQEVTIFNGDSTVQTENGTNFGFTIPSSDPIPNTFKLSNLGSVSNITDISVSLADGTHFTIIETPSGTILPVSTGDLGKFMTIQYNPAVTGVHRDTVRITYDAGGDIETFEFAIAGTATTSLNSDNYENNNFGSAPANLNNVEDVWLSDYKGLAFTLTGDPDWYIFTKQAGDEFVIVNSLHNPFVGNLRFELYHGNRGKLSSVLAINENSYGNMQYRVHEDLVDVALTFYVLVTAEDPTTTRVEYDLKWSAFPLTAGDDDLYEPNDSLETAHDLTGGLGPSLSDQLGLGISNDEDWYKITVPWNPFNRMLYVAAEFDHAQGNIDIQVFRAVGSDYEMLGSSVTENDREVVTHNDHIQFNDYDFIFNPESNNNVMGLEPATYYVRVYGDFAGNSYDLTVEPRSDDAYETLDSGEENDLQGDAFPLGEAIVGKWLSEIDGVGTCADYPETATVAEFENDSDEDWYSFNLPAGKIVKQITLDYRSFNGEVDGSNSGFNGFLDYSIYDAAGNKVVSTGDGSSDPGTLTINNLASNTYWIRVASDNLISRLTGYDFRVEVLEQPPLVENPIEDNYEENDRFDELYNITQNEGRWLSGLNGYGAQWDADWYEIAIPANVSKLTARLFHLQAEGDMDLTLSTKDGPVHFVAAGGSNNEIITWENPFEGEYALTVTGERKGNFYNLLWDLTYSEDNYEENDTRETAFNLTGNERRFLSKLNGSGIQKDDDWFRISAGADTVELRVNATFIHEEGDIDLALYNSAGSLIRRSISSNDNESLVYPNPAAGDYFVRVYYDNAGNEYDLTWAALTQAELDAVPVGDDAYEENDTIDSPYSLTTESPRLSSSLGLGIQSDDDWFEIEVPAGNVGLLVECLFADAEGDIDLELYDPLGFPVVIRDSITDNEIVEFTTPVPAGIYQIRVYGPGLGNEYDLYWTAYVEDRYEDNDSFGAPYDLSLEIGAPLDSPTLGDEDWYRFVATGPTPHIRVDLDYIDANGAVNFQILDESQNVILTVDSTDDSESVIIAVSSGTYYVRVYGSEFYNNYDMTISVFGDDDYEENDVSGDAKSIVGDTAINLVQFDTDWFQFEVTEANAFLSVIASFTHANGNIDLALYESADLVNPIATSATAQNHEGIRVEGTVGTYYIEVTGDNRNSAYTLLWTVSPDDQYEQNDEFIEAADLTLGNGDRIDAIQFDEDWFEVLVQPGNVRLVAELEYLQVDGNINITLYDKKGHELAFEDTETDNEVLSYSVYPFGTSDVTYYIKVSGVNLGTAYGLTWATSNEDNFEGETGNNLYSDPSDVLLANEGQRISGTIGYGGALNDDWYKVQINPGDDGLVIEAFFIHTAEHDIDLELFGENDILLARSIGTSNVERIHYKGSAGTTYYLRVFGKSGGNPYDLVWNSYKEDNLEIGVETYETPKDPPDNDSPETPRSLRFPKLNLTERGSTNLEFVKLDELTQLDEDWYLVEVLEGEDIFILELEFEHIFGDIDVALYKRAVPDPSDPSTILEPVVLIEQAESQTDGESIKLPDLEPGEYLICVYGYGYVNPKADPSWAPEDFDPYADDLETWAGYDSIKEDGVDDYYELADSHARGLGNTYSLRWISTVEDEYDIETPDDPGDAEVNDTQEHPAIPELRNQYDVVDSDGIIDGSQSTQVATNCDGEPVTFKYRSVYTYRGLTQLDDDWYAFTVDVGSVHYFFASIIFSNFHANLDLLLYDSSGTLLAKSDNTASDVEFIEVQGTGLTTYYLQVVGEDLGTSYSLQVRGSSSPDDDYEENDNITEANVNANITDLRCVNLDDIFIQRDDDYFRVDLPKDQVHLEFSVSSFVLMNVEVLDATGTPLPDGYARSGGTSDAISYKYGVISPEAATYYIKVTGSNNGFSYGIEWSYDNVDEYDGYFDNDSPSSATELTRWRLEPVYAPPPAQQPLQPIKELAFDYGLLSGLTLGRPAFDPFGHAIQEGEDWYAIQIPSWFLTGARKGSDSIQVLKRDYYVRLSAEIEFTHVDGDINMEIYDETDLVTPLARSETANDIESLFARIDPTDEARYYFIRVYGDNKANDYSLKWDVSKDDAYEELEDELAENDTNNFIDLAYDLTNVNGVSTENTWLHEIEYLQDVNGDGVINGLDGGFTNAKGFGMQITDDWYAVVVSQGATQIMVDCRFYSDNDTGYIYAPDDIDVDFEVYFLAGNDGDPGTTDLRRPVLVGRSTGDTDDSLFSSAGNNSESLTDDITTEIQEMATFDVDESGIYFIRIYHNNRPQPYTFTWDDIGDADNSGDAAIIDDYLNGSWSMVIEALPLVPIVAPAANFDGDQFPNWAEFALGLDTSVAEHSVVSQSIIEIENKRYYKLEFTRNVNAEGLGYEFIVKESESLSFGAGRAIHMEDIAIPGTDLERAIYRSTKPIDQQGRCFFRLVVNEPTSVK